ncbi:MAG: sigma-70 family RNA polymerase sigma factor [Ruminococcaceae bacterium]|nr:sigma-70 family RNA polymerase sigma factor [Oscillospiraceae bacterium]
MKEVPISDAQLIAGLLERREPALEALSQQYGRLVRKLLHELLSDPYDVEECANDVLLAIWNSIPPHRPMNLPAYLCKLTRRIGIDRYRRNTRQKRGAGYTLLLSELSDALPDTSVTSRSPEEDPLPDALDRFLKKLDASSRVLFLRRYVLAESVKSLSDRFEMSETALSVKLFRIRKKLKEFLKKEGISV